MYYSYKRMSLKKNIRLCVFLLAAVLAAFSFQPPIYAASLSIKDQAKEYRDKGYAAQLSGNIDNATAFYQKAISLDPSFAAAYNDLGVIYEMRSDIDRAEESYLKAVEQDNSYLAAYSNLAYLYEKKGNPLKAALLWKKRIQRSLAQDPWQQKAQDNLRRLAAMSGEVRDMLIKEELAGFNAEVANRVRHKRIDDLNQKILLAKEHFNQGDALLKQKRFAAALEEFRFSKAITPSDKNIDAAIDKATQALLDEKVNEYASNGLKYYQVGDKFSARNEFKKLLAIIPASNHKSK